MEELFEPCAVEFPRRRVMILRKDRLQCSELGNCKDGFAGVDSLECLKHLNWRGIDLRGLHHCRFLVDPIEKHVVERPLFGRRKRERDRGRAV